MGALDASLSQIRATATYVRRFVGTAVPEGASLSSIPGDVEAVRPLVPTFTGGAAAGGTLAPAGSAFDVLA